MSVEGWQSGAMDQNDSDLLNDFSMTSRLNQERSVMMDQLPFLATSSASKRSFDAVNNTPSQPPSSSRRRSSASTNKHSRRSSVATKPSHPRSGAAGFSESYDEHSNSNLDLDEPQTPDTEDDGSHPGLKERSREKNKVAAAKCRAKKRENMEIIESSHRSLSAENTYLKKHEQQLRATVAELRTLALDHQHCNCGVHQYNMIQAGNLARGLGDLHTQHFGATSHNRPCAVHSGSSGTQSTQTSQASAAVTDLHSSQDKSSPFSNDFSQVNHQFNQFDRLSQTDQLTQMDSMSRLEQTNFPFDLGPDNLFDLQTPMEPFFAEFNNANNVPHGLS